MRVIKFSISLLLAMWCCIAQAQEWPTRPVKIIVSQAGGAAPDIICRIIADRLSAILGQQFIIDNRPGGANIVGSQAAARSAPDGYTFFFATAAALATNPHTFKSLPYDPQKDFVPVAFIATAPFFLLAHPSLNAKSLDEVFALDKKAPGTISIATEGSRNFSGMLASWVNKKAGTNFVEVPYTTITNGVQDALAGRVKLISLPITTAAPFIGSGELKPLAVSSAKPAAKFESIPPIANTLPGVELIGWFAMVAPAGTPEPIIRKLNQALAKALDEPALRNRMLELGAVTEGAGTVEATGEFLKQQYNVWKQVVSDIGLEPQ